MVYGISGHKIAQTMLMFILLQGRSITITGSILGHIDLVCNRASDMIFKVEGPKHNLF